MTLTLVNGPSTALWTADEIDRHLQVTASEDSLTADETAYLNDLLETARRHVDGADGILNRALITQTWDYTLPWFSRVMELPLPPLQSVEQITYLDTDGNSQTLAASDYRTIAGDNGIVHFKENIRIPRVINYPDAVTIRFIAGYGDNATDVPQPIRQAVLLLISHWFETRSAALVAGEQSSVDTRVMPFGVRALLTPFMKRRFGQ